MSRIRATLAVYRLERFGYYEHGGKTPAFGTIPSILRDLRGWINDKEHEETATQAPGDDPQRRTFCLDVRSHNETGDFLVTLWNESTAAGQQLASLALKSKVGAPQVQTHNPPPDSATGHASYFWFIQEREVVTLVRYLGLSGGGGRMCRYITTFLKYFGQHVIHPEDETDPYTIVGYRADAKSKRHDKFTRPMVAIRPAMDVKVVEHLHRNRASIRRVIGSRTLVFQDKGEVDKGRRFLEFFGIAKPKMDTRKEMSVNFEAEFTPTKEELTELINDYAPGDDDPLSFYLASENRTVSLEHAFLRAPIDTGFTTATLFDSARLMTRLQRERDGLLKRLA